MFFVTELEKMRRLGLDRYRPKGRKIQKVTATP
jgi:hypothetical protein